MSEACIGKTWLGGGHAHRFEARYDVGVPDTSKCKDLALMSWNDDPAAYRAKTYVHDVCTRCGKIIDRPSRGQSNG